MSAPANPRQDREAGFKRVIRNGRALTTYDPEIGLKIVERIAAGELLTEICKPGTGMPAFTTFMNWVARIPELQKAYSAARELSAMAFEEQALRDVAELKLAPGDNQHLRAAELAISQYRWSAARRDPRNYGDRGNMQVVVPIHIQTTLDMGSNSQVGGVEIPDIYTIEAGEIRDLTAEVPPLPAGVKPLALSVEDMGSEKTAIGAYDPHRKLKRVLKPRVAMDEDIQKLKAEGKL